jgi:radical SAM superfamily enzyme YgiQ (UPF0313 family)
MKVLLIRPPYDTRSISPNFPIGLAYLAGALRDSGHEPHVLDLPMHRRPFELLRRCLAEDFYPLIGISSMTIQYPGARDVVEIARDVTPSSRIVLGGPHPSVLPAETLAETGCDYVVKGEGEFAIVRLADAVEAGSTVTVVPSLVFREGDRVRVNSQGSPLVPDLIPLPAYDSFDLEPYFSLAMSEYVRPGSRPMPIFTSRGCPFQCTFCHDLFTKKFRGRSADPVVREILLLHRNYGVDEFLIYDDIFNLDLGRAKSMFRKVVESGIRAGFSFPNGLRVEIVDDELMSLMAAAGVHTISFAIETASDRMQRIIKKRVKLDRVAHSLSLAKRYGIRTQAFFIIGFPQETRAEINQTIRFARSLRDLDYAFFSFATPYPGTEFARELEQQGFAPALHMSSLDFYEPHVATPEFSFGDLRWLRFKAALTFYATPRRTGNLIREMLNPHFRELYMAPLLRMLRMA